MGTNPAGHQGIRIEINYCLAPLPYLDPAEGYDEVRLCRTWRRVWMDAKQTGGNCGQWSAELPVPSLYVHRREVIFALHAEALRGFPAAMSASRTMQFCALWQTRLTIRNVTQPPSRQSGTSPRWGRLGTGITSLAVQFGISMFRHEGVSDSMLCTICTFLVWSGAGHRA